MTVERQDTDAADNPPFVVDIAFGDCDPMGQVFYPNYARWADAAAWAYLDRFGAAAAGIGSAAFLPLVAVDMQFLAPSRRGDRLQIVTTIADIGRTSLALRHEFGCEGKPRAVVTEKRVHVVIDGAEAPSRPLPDGLRRALEAGRLDI